MVDAVRKMPSSSSLPLLELCNVVLPPRGSFIASSEKKPQLDKARQANHRGSGAEAAGGKQIFLLVCILQVDCPQDLGGRGTYQDTSGSHQACCPELPSLPELSGKSDINTDFAPKPPSQECSPKQLGQCKPEAQEPCRGSCMNSPVTQWSKTDDLGQGDNQTPAVTGEAVEAVPAREGEAYADLGGEERKERNSEFEFARFGCNCMRTQNKLLVPLINFTLSPTSNVKCGKCSSKIRILAAFPSLAASTVHHSHKLGSSLPALGQGGSPVTGVDLLFLALTCSSFCVPADSLGTHLDNVTFRGRPPHRLHLCLLPCKVVGLPLAKQIRGNKGKRVAAISQYTNYNCNRVIPTMQQPANNHSLGKDKDSPEKDLLLDEETQPALCDQENSNSNRVPWKLPETQPCSCMEKTESPQPEEQSQDCKTYLGISSEQHCENQGNLLHFDRQAPSRISTSPTLRRLRNSGCGTSRSLSQQETFKVPTWGSWKAPAVSSHFLSQSLPGSLQDSFNLSSPVRTKVDWTPKVPLDADSALNAADFFQPQTGPAEEHAPPESPSINEGSLPQASLPGTGGQSLPSLTPRSPTPQGPESHPCRFFEHRRSSVVLNLPGLEMFPGDLLVSDGAADYMCHPLLVLNSESKKPRWPFSKRGVGKDRHKHISDLENCLSSVKIIDFRGSKFHNLKDKTWNEVMEIHQNLPTDQLDLRKQQEAMWELFTSECTYFLDHLLVLKVIFMNTLKYLQDHEYLLDVDLWRLFANLEELSQTSSGFVNSLFSIIKDYVDASETSPPMDFISVLAKYFRGSLCQSHQTYCLNYSAAVFYLESLRQRDDFGIYLKWCEQNEQCKRLHLPELLVAPLHRLTRYPLLLKNIWKRSTDSTEKIMIYSLKDKVEKSIRDLEGKVKWLDNFQKCRHLQEIIVWPPLWDRDKRFFIPEGLKHIFKEHTAENILSPTNRHLLYEGKLTLAENTRFLDVYLFLFDDFLLVTKTKRNKKKPGGSDPGLICPSLTPELQTIIKEGGSCTVLDQPIPLDRVLVRSIDPLHVSVFGLRNAFLIQHENRYRQCIAAFLLQAQTENIKKAWMAQIAAAISCFTKNQETKKIPLFTLPAESSEI
ncbi:pleckstrin homology domain-containing family G member 7 [Talpa occidentalis]|uniref:pleckstrin homology domain-containing family G member 7 n=1 Tax=Talpa occidentalis TaxID=50954 RepID=UPI00188F1B46|nr:pleckstrin homology domain-containing family G member 7 [Talpa occidentalis]